MELQDMIVIIVSALGFISLSKRILSFFKWVWLMFLRPPKNIKQEYGSWAIVTGSTDGIGKAIAFELASKGLNLVLVGRNPSKLEATTREIRDKVSSKVEIKNIALDFAKCSGEEASRAVEEGIQGLEVGLLVNNAGVAYSKPWYFHEVDMEISESIRKVNLEAATWVAKSVILAMLKKKNNNKSKKKGAIINIGSGSSLYFPSYPLFTLYASSKAYLSMFSKCISLEYKNQGIDVQCQFPLLTATKMTKVKASWFISATPESYARASVRCIGCEYFSCPLWNHSIVGLLIWSLPASLINKMTTNYFIGMRERGRKKEKSLKVKD